MNHLATMSAGFGFSVGDMIAGLSLIKRSIAALQDARGAIADYQGLLQEVEGLSDALEAVRDLELEEALGADSKPCVAIRGAVSRCRACIDSFLASISKYQPALREKARSVAAWKSKVRKIQWTLCSSEDVAKFRTQLERHSSAINMLLVTLQV